MLRLAWFALALVPVNAWGQLYLIAGWPTPEGTGSGYSTSLLSVQTEGPVAAQEIVPAKVGSGCMTISYDERKVVLFSGSSDGKVIVVDFDTASVTKSCKDPDGSILVVQFLIESPSRGLMFVGYASPPAPFDKPEPPELLGMILDPTVSCQGSFVKLDVSDVKYPLVLGSSFPVAGDLLEVSMSAEGALSEAWLSGERTYLDYKVPTSMFDYSKHLPELIAFNTANSRHTPSRRATSSSPQARPALARGANNGIRGPSIWTICRHV